MSLLNHDFLAFGGEPVTGRMPTQLHVDGPELTREQRGAVAHAYKLFCDVTKVSLPGYEVRHKTLPDGTQIRMEHTLAGDRVFVTTRPVAPQGIELGGYVLLPHDAAHLAGWNKGAIADSARTYLKERNTFALPAKPELHVKLNAGAVDWQGEQKVILTWDHNGNNRHHTAMWNTVFTGTNNDSASQGIYYKGTKINTDHGVSSAAIFQGNLVYISNGALYAAASPIGRIDQALAAGQFVKEVSPAWSTISITGSVNTSRRASAWHFKPDGSRAACAVVDSAFGVGTWTMERMRTEAVTQAKRYIDLSIVAGAVAAAVSDTAYTAEAFAAYEDANLVDVDITVAAGGAITLTGKRLWGVDFDATGAELVISCERAGSGTSFSDTTAGAEHFTIALTSHWAVLVNGVELFRADYVIPEITVTGGSPTTYVQTGAGLIKLEYLAVHALDARYAAAVIERLTLAYAASATGCTGAQTAALNLARWHAFDPFVVTPKLQVLFSGTVVAEYAETVDASLMPPLHANLDAGNLLTFYRFGMGWKPEGNTFLIDESAYLFIPGYPQISDWANENIYEQLFIDNGSATNREPHNLFKAYPNQVSDALAKQFFRYEIQATTLEFLIFWDTSRLGAFNSTNIPDLTTTRQAAFLLLGAATPIVQGLAIPKADTLHFIGSTNETFVNQFFDQVTKLKQLNAGTAQTGVTPIYRTSVFTRSTTSDPFVEADIGATIEAAVVADGTTVDSATFQLNPVRVL